MKTNPICLALDSQDLESTTILLEKIRPFIGMIKIGPIMYFSHGKSCLELGNKFNMPIFLDLKLHDIPKTVGKTINILSEQFKNINGNHLISIHVSGSVDMCKVAKEATANTNLEIAGVTILSSLNRSDLSRHLKFKNCLPSLKTINLIDCGKEGGLNTFVCSPPTLPQVRKYFKTEKIICPGIRTLKDEDHKQSKPFSFALKEGADICVIGKPITEAKDPEEAAGSLTMMWESFIQKTEHKI